MSCIDIPEGTVIPVECRPHRVPGKPWSGLKSAFVSIPAGWGRHWYAALGECDTRLVRIVVFGASLTLGQKASPSYTNGYIGRMRTALQAFYGDGGSGFIANSYRTEAGSPVTSTGAWTEVAGEGGVAIPALRPTTSGNGATVTFNDVRGRYIKVFLRRDPTFADWTWTINGNAQTPLDNAGTAGIVVQTVDMGVGNEGPHDVVITASAGTGRLYGVGGYNDTGLVVENDSLAAGQVAFLEQATTGLTSTDPVDNTLCARALDAFGPTDLVILALLPNEVIVPEATEASLDTIRDALDIFHAAARLRGPSDADPPDLVWITEHISEADIVPGFALYDRGYSQVAEIGEGWARTVGAAHFNMWAAGHYSYQWMVDQGYFDGSGGDTVHFDNEGHAWAVDPLLNLVGG